MPLVEEERDESMVVAKDSKRREEERVEDVAISFQDGNLVVGGEIVLEGVQNGIHEGKETFQSSSAGAMSCTMLLDLSAEASQAQHEHSLGKLHVQRWMSNSRYKLWWMMPAWGCRGSDVPPETQMLVCELYQIGKYVVFLPMIDSGNEFRSSLLGAKERGREQEVVLRVESNCEITAAQEISGVLLVSASTSPFEAMSAAVHHASTYLGTFCTREQKVVPPSVDLFGWCTWDAFYSSVDAQGIELGIASLEKGNCPAKCLIIDDGWQSTAADRMPRSFSGNNYFVHLCLACVDLFWTVWAFAIAGWYLIFVHFSRKGSISMKIWEYMVNNFIGNWIKMEMDKRCDFTKRLTSPLANQKFRSCDAAENSGLADLVATVKDKYDVKFVYCWHAMTGYWGGVCPNSKDMASFGAQLRKTKHYPGVEEVEPFTNWDAFKLAGVGVIPPNRISDFYMCLHDGLKKAGVDGVKVDVQALVGALGYGMGGGPQLTYAYHKALEKSVARHFPGNHLINCMCHSNENLFRYAETNVVRASDDFYPKDRASHTVHIVNVVYNSFFLGEIAVPDWDMFHSQHEAGSLHAAARAVGGCSVYVSDKPGQHDFDLLSKLVLPDGRILRAKLPGRPTRDCLFHDVQRDGKTALKVWNLNAVTGVVGAFNVQGVFYNRFIRKHVFHQRRAENVIAHVSPNDLEQLESPTGLFACYLFNRGFCGLLGVDCNVRIELAPKDWELVHFSPVWQVNAARVSPIGLVSMLNSGGSISKVEENNGCFSIVLQGSGRFLCYCDSIPSSCLLTNYGAQDSTYSIYLKHKVLDGDLLEIFVPAIDGSLAHHLHLQF